MLEKTSPYKVAFLGAYNLQHAKASINSASKTGRTLRLVSHSFGKLIFEIEI